MNPDLNVQPTVDQAGILFNQIVNLVVWFLQTYGVDLGWMLLITLVVLGLLAILRIFNIV